MRPRHSQIHLGQRTVEAQLEITTDKDLRLIEEWKNVTIHEPYDLFFWFNTKINSFDKEQN